MRLAVVKSGLYRDDPSLYTCPRRAIVLLFPRRVALLGSCTPSGSQQNFPAAGRGSSRQVSGEVAAFTSYRVTFPSLISRLSIIPSARLSLPSYLCRWLAFDRSRLKIVPENFTERTCRKCGKSESVDICSFHLVNLTFSSRGRRNFSSFRSESKAREIIASVSSKPKRAMAASIFNFQYRGPAVASLAIYPRR